MNTRKLGSSGLEVGPLGFGGNVFGWTIDEATSFRIARRLRRRRASTWSTRPTSILEVEASGNQGGESETIIGKWFQESGKRDRVVLATKVGMELGPDKKGLSRELHPSGPSRTRLRRLRTDHGSTSTSRTRTTRRPRSTRPSGLFRSLIQQGKVRAIGVSNYSSERLAEALKVSKDLGLPAYQCLQPQYNLCERAGFEDSLGPLCVKEGIGVIPYYALASGLLTGKYRSEADLAKSPRGSSAGKYRNERGFRILAALDHVAGRLDSAPVRVGDRLVDDPGLASLPPIASATSLAQLDDLIEATRLELDEPAIELLNQAST